MGRVVTRKQKIRDIPMPTWFVQLVESLAAYKGQDLDYGN